MKQIFAFNLPLLYGFSIGRKCAFQVKMNNLILMKVMLFIANYYIVIMFMNSSLCEFNLGDSASLNSNVFEVSVNWSFWHYN